MHSLPSHRSKLTGCADDVAYPELGVAALLQLNRVINTLPQAIYWKDEHNRFLGCNQAFAQLAALPDPKALLGKSDEELLGDIQRQLLSDRDPIILQTNQAEHHTLELTDSCDRSTWFSVQKLPLQDDDGSAIGVVCTIEDVSAAKAELKQKQSEADILAARDSSETQADEHQLKDSKAFLRQVLNGVDDPIFVKDHDHRWVLVNDSFCRFLGRDRAELLNKSDYDFFPKAEADIFRQKDESVFATGDTNENEESFTDKEGKTTTISTKKSPFTDQNNHQFLVGTIRDISASKQAEAASRQQEEFLRNIYNGVDLYIAVIDVAADNSFLFAGINPKTEQAINVSNRDACGKTLEELLGAAGQQLRHNCQRCLQADVAISYEEQVEINGTVIWGLTTLSPSRDRNGKIDRIILTSIDMTARKQAELALEQLNEALETRVEERTAALRKSEARLRALMDNLPFGVWAADIDSRCVVQNLIALDHWGDLVGKQPQDLDLAPEVIDLWLEENHRVLSGEILRKESYYQHDAHGDWFCSMILAPIWDGDRITGLLGVSIDVTEQKRTETALRENENTLRGILQNMPVMMDAFDENGNIITWNSECERVTGYSAQEIIGNPNAMELLYVDPVYREQMIQTWARLGNNYRNWEWQIWCKDGTIKTVIWSNLSGQFPVAGWANWGIAIDISDRKQAELQLQASESCLRQQTQELTDTLKKLQRTQSQLVQSEKMSSLGQLVAGVAHEINNPVNFIYGNLSYADEYVSELLDLLELYQQEYLTPTVAIQDKVKTIDLEFLLEDLPKLLNSMKVGAERIQAIVASLRTFSRMDEAEVKAVDIHEGIDSTLMILQSRFKRNQERYAIAVVKNYGDLPLVECYAGQLNQVFMNILSNAIDALEESDRSSILREKNSNSPCITIQTEKLSPDRIVISIIDNGTGISDSVQQRLFDPFFTTKEVGKGTGMGLSISYQIVTEKHGGSLNCISALGQGAEFRIEIPISQCST